MTARAAETEAFEDEYEEYDEFDDEDGEESGGLSGLVVLLMGVVMLGAFASVVWIAYQQGIKAGGERGTTPYVAADPEPLKIENAAGAQAADTRSVYDRFAGEAGGSDVEVIAAGPEEPVTRAVEDPIAAIAAANEPLEVADEVADRLAALAEADDELSQPAVPDPTPPRQTATPAPAQQTPPAQAAAEPARQAASTNAGALSGTHLVQVGAFGSDAEAMGTWTRLQGRLGDYLDGKSPDVERADLAERGIFYRLRIGPFASSDAARTYCEGLKSRGQDCLVRAN